MKKIFAILILAFTISTTSTQAQDKKITLKIRGGDKKPNISEKEVSKLKVSDFFLYSSTSFQRSPLSTLADFRILAPNSTLLNKDLSDFQGSNFTSYYGFYNSFFYQGENNLSMNLGISFRDASRKGYKNSPLLRLGVTYSNGTQFGSFLSKQESFAYDTLTVTSSKTNTTIYLDSVYSQYYNMNYTAEQIRLDGSLIFRTNKEARWSLFAGIGFNFGMSINSTTNINYFSSSYINSKESGDYNVRVYSNYNFGDQSFSSEVYKNKPAFGFATYVPMGLDFRVGKYDNLLGKMHLFCEFRPGLNYYSVPELSGNLNTFLQSGLGLRVSL